MLAASAAAIDWPGIDWMKMTDVSVSYKSFWEALLSQSNRRTGFSIRHAAKRKWVYYQLVGFQFTYKLDWLLPGATVSFELRRSDGEEIFEHLLQRRAQLDSVFGGALSWHRSFVVPDDRYPVPAIVTSVACPGLSELPREQWPSVQEQMIDAMVRLERAVAPQVALWLPE